VATEPAKVIYGKRKTIVEPVFGQIKNSGFRGFSVRGKEKVAGEFSMVFTAHTTKKLPRPLFAYSDQIAKYNLGLFERFLSSFSFGLNTLISRNIPKYAKNRQE